MDPILNSINQDLTDLEEKLLVELGSLRKSDAGDTYCKVNFDLRAELQFTLEALSEALDNSGDSTNLSLKTFEHEMLEARMSVLRSLTTRNIPSLFIELSHEEVTAERQQVEAMVGKYRTESHSKGLSADELNRLTAFERTINPDRVSEPEVDLLGHTKGAADKGLYSASRELAVLNQQVSLHHDEGHSIDKVAQERADFNSRDLSAGHVSDKRTKGDLAQSPDEIKRKLENQSASGSGPSRFVAKDLAGGSTPAPAKPRRRKDIAQSPEQIKKKLEEQGTESSGKAVFGSRDVEHVAAKPAPQQKNPEPPPPPPAGKAVFGSKDIESLDETLNRKAQQQQRKQSTERPAGKAIFESKDLSEPKP